MTPSLGASIPVTPLFSSEHGAESILPTPPIDRLDQYVVRLLAESSLTAWVRRSVQAMATYCEQRSE